MFFTVGCREPVLCRALLSALSDSWTWLWSRPYQQTSMLDVSCCVWVGANLQPGYRIRWEAWNQKSGGWDDTLSHHKVYIFNVLVSTNIVQASTYCQTCCVCHRISLFPFFCQSSVSPLEHFWFKVENQKTLIVWQPKDFPLHSRDKEHFDKMCWWGRIYLLVLFFLSCDQTFSWSSLTSFSFNQFFRFNHVRNLEEKWSGSCKGCNRKYSTIRSKHGSLQPRTGNLDSRWL